MQNAGKNQNEEDLLKEKADQEALEKFIKGASPEQMGQELLSELIKQNVERTSLQCNKCKALTLIESGANIFERDLFGSSSLYWAALSGNVVVGQALIDAGARLDEQEKQTLSLAKPSNHERTITVLKAEKAAREQDVINTEKAAKEAEFSKFIKEGSPEEKGDALLVELKKSDECDVGKALSLIENGAFINQTDFFKVTPLIEAAKHGLTSVAEALLDKGADFDHKSRGDYTALWHAEKENHIAIVDLIKSAEEKRDLSIKEKAFAEERKLIEGLPERLALLEKGLLEEKEKNKLLEKKIGTLAGKFEKANQKKNTSKNEKDVKGKPVNKKSANKNELG